MASRSRLLSGGHAASLFEVRPDQSLKIQALNRDFLAKQRRARERAATEHLRFGFDDSLAMFEEEEDGREEKAEASRVSRSRRGERRGSRELAAGKPSSKTRRRKRNDKLDDIFDAVAAAAAAASAAEDGCADDAAASAWAPYELAAGNGTASPAFQRRESKRLKKKEETKKPKGSGAPKETALPS